MRILMTTDTLGGVWNYALLLSGELAQFGIEVILATMGRALSSAQRSQASQISNIQLRESTYELEWMIDPWEQVREAGKWLLNLERQEKPDLIHFNNFVHAALPFRTPKLVVAHSCVYSWWRAVHGQYPDFEWNHYYEQVQAGLSAADLVVSPSQAMLDELLSAYELQLPNTLVIANGTNIFRPESVDSPYSKESYIFSAGRLWDPAKNLSVLNNVAAYLSWPVFSAGSTEDPRGENVAYQNVTLLGQLTTGQIAERYSEAAIFAHPALYEPFGLSVLEAAAAGCALVLGDISSLRENWADAAIFVNPRDEEELYGALDHLIRNERERRELGFKARSRAADLSSAKMGAKYLLAYERLLMQRAPAHVHQSEPKASKSDKEAKPCVF